MRNALITGGTGFVGGYLARFLAASGWRVTAIHRHSASASELEHLAAAGVSTVAITRPVEIQDILRDLAPDVIFHLAAHQAKDPPGNVDTYVEANLTLGLHLLEAAAGSDCVVVTAMSYSQFRAGRAVPASLYSATKQAFLVLAEYYGSHRGVDVRHVVLYDNYGPRDPRDKLITQLVSAVREGTTIAMGPAEQRINLLHVADVSTGLVAASEQGNPALMTVRAPSTVSVGEIAEAIERVSGSRLQKTFDAGRMPSDQPEMAGNWPLPRGWEPRWGLEDGLHDILNAVSDLRV